jgi:hypothetical protein
VWNLTSLATVDKHVVFGCGGLQRIAGQMLEFGHAQIRSGDEIGGCPETARGSLGLEGVPNFV